MDLCDAHVLALQHLTAGGESRVYNLGNGQGYSVKEVIQVTERVSGKKVPVQYGSRRVGDPPRLVADASKIRLDWGWTPRFGALEQIIEHCLAVENKNKTYKINGQNCAYFNSRHHNSPELTGIGKYSGEMAQWLAAQGHEVRVVTAPPHYPQWRVAEGYANRWSKEQVQGARGKEMRCRLNLAT